MYEQAPLAAYQVQAYLSIFAEEEGSEAEELESAFGEEDEAVSIFFGGRVAMPMSL